MPNKTKKKRLVLLDAHAILHRAYHALPDFTTEDGEPTGALYGLSAMLIKIVGDLKPDYMAACYDLPGPTLRHGAYEEYKAQRKETEDDLIRQIDRSRDIFEAFNIPVYEKEGYEADDLLGTIVKKLKNKKDIEVVIASGDNDTLQLVDGKCVTVYTLRKGIKDTVVYDEEAVRSRFGFGPEFIADFKGLSGDPSDNIPGVAGIGEKTARTLIEAFGGVESIYKTLEKDEASFEKAGIKPRVIRLLKEGEEEAQFSRELAEIHTDVPLSFSLPGKKWRDGLDVAKILELFRLLSFRTLSERVKSVFGEEEDGASGRTDETKEVEEVGEQELKETAIALWLLDSNITNPTKDDILGFANTRSFSKAREHIISELKKQDLLKVFENIEKPLIPIIEEMEERGIAIDTGYLKKLSDEYHKKLDALEKKIYKKAGMEFNINSPKQLGEVLFDTLAIKPKRKALTATGQRSTRESELKKLKDEHPIVEDILSYRELQKLVSTYIDNIPHMVSDKDGRLHADFLQAGTTTGRMSSQNPNLQNIPTRTEHGRRVRNAFVSEDGHVLVAFDYSQIELRVAAFLSGDTKLIETFKEGEDIHARVASEVFDVSEDKVDAEMRRRAKVINFGIQYGMGVNALAAATGSTRAEAEKFLKDYAETFSGLVEYLDSVKAEARKKGYTETYFGRRRLLPGINSRLPYVRAEAERQALNAPIQGTQADIVKIAMVRARDELAKKNLLEKTHLILQVHDELIYEVEESAVDEVKSTVRGVMESVMTEKQTKGVPIEVNVAIGKSWGDMEV